MTVLRRSSEQWFGWDAASGIGFEARWASATMKQQNKGPGRASPRGAGVLDIAVASRAEGVYGHPCANASMKQMKSSTLRTGSVVLLSQLA
jgi:hypothetical protein